MRKFTLVCRCGQRLRARNSEIGKTGMCPSCGKTLNITSKNTGQKSRSWAGKRKRPAPPRGEKATIPTEEAMQRFGRALDLFREARYAEALSIFNSLARDYPGNANIESGRDRCLSVLNCSSLPGAEGQRLLPESAELNTETVKRVVLDLLLHASSEEVRIQAAALAYKILNATEDSEARDGSDSQGEQERTDTGASGVDPGAHSPEEQEQDSEFRTGDASRVFHWGDARAQNDRSAMGDDEASAHDG